MSSTATVSEAERATRAGAAILVVDDDAGKRLSTIAALESLGLTIVEADSGEAALEAVLSGRFAVILMDVKMPLMDGYETARLMRLHRRCETTPIIFITGYARDEAELPVAYASGAVDFIVAPVVPAILRAKVSVFVDLFLKAHILQQYLSEVTMLSERFRDSEARTRSVLEHVADGIVTLDHTGVIETFNRSACELFGYTEHEAIGLPLGVIVSPEHPDGSAGAQATPAQLLTPQRRGNGTGTWVGRRKDGSTVPVDLDLSDVELGARQILICCIRDISERQTYTDNLRYQTLHDELTGLPNRVLFRDRVDHAIRAALGAEEPLALLILDLDDFKAINDTLGHECGDRLLQLVSERIVGCLREGDTVARLGGDEFGVLPLGGTNRAGAAIVAWKIQQALEPTFAIESHVIHVRASVGMVFVPEHGSTSDDLLRRADLAMYEAKRSRAGYALFTAEHEEAPTRRLSLLRDLRRCIEGNELVLHYQPKIDLTTRRTIGVEALVRWNHPSGRLAMPDEFMPEVEGSELMLPFTEWVANEALRTLRAWRDDGYDLTMAINVGARCLAPGSHLFETLATLTTRWGIPTEKLTLELTEAALIDTAVPGLLDQLHAAGECLSIDDFGTGYSSLLYLQRLPVVEIKADRSFVSSMCTVKADAVIVRSTIDLAHNLGMRVVAEGVEDEQTLGLLIEYGCDEAQGYHFSRPLPTDALAAWLRESPFGLTRRPGGTNGTGQGQRAAGRLGTYRRVTERAVTPRA